MSCFYVVQVQEKIGKVLQLRLEQVHPEASFLGKKGEEVEPSLLLLLLWEGAQRGKKEGELPPLLIAFDWESLREEDWIRKVAQGIVRRGVVLHFEKGGSEAFQGIYELEVEVSHEGWLIGIEVGEKWESAAFSLAESLPCEPILPEVVERIVGDSEEGFSAFYVAPGRAPCYSFFAQDLKIGSAVLPMPYRSWKFYGVAGDGVPLQDTKRLWREVLGQPVVFLEEKGKVPSAVEEEVPFGLLVSAYPHQVTLVRESGRGEGTVRTLFTSQGGYLAPIHYVERFVKGLKPPLKKPKPHPPKYPMRPFMTHYHLAALSGEEKKLVRFLEEGHDPNLAKESGHTLLHTAVFHPKIVELLLEKGADPFAQDVEGHTPLMLAAYFGVFESVRILVQRMKKKMNQFTLWEEDRGKSFSFSSLEEVRSLRKEVGRYWFVTDFAILGRHWAILEYLLSQGALFLRDWWIEESFWSLLKEEERELLSTLYEKYVFLPWKKEPLGHLYAQAVKKLFQLASETSFEMPREFLTQGLREAFRVKVQGIPLVFLLPTLMGLPADWKHQLVKPYVGEVFPRVLAALFYLLEISPEDLQES